jgi:ankyrin repeat protein
MKAARFSRTLVLFACVATLASSWMACKKQAVEAPPPPPPEADPLESLSANELFEAAKAGEVDKMKPAFKKNTALAESKDAEGRTMLHVAAAAGQKAVAEFLLAEKAKVNATDTTGATPLHLAVVTDRTEVADLLIHNGADVKSKDSAGSTPLHAAAAAGQRTMIELLLASKADISAKNANSLTALQLAAKSGKNDAAAFLRTLETKAGKDKKAEDSRKARVDFIKKRASEGADSAQYELGVLHLKGDGVEKDEAAAREWLKKAADGGNTLAKRKLQDLDNPAKVESKKKK